MNDDMLDDLKQFIATAVRQETTELKGDIADMYAKLRTDIATLDQKIDDLSRSVTEGVEANNEATDGQLKNHEQHLTHLEQEAA